MTLRWLLDTNVVSDHVLGVAAVQERLRITPPSTVAFSCVSEMELHYGLGLAPARAAALEPALDALLANMTILTFSRDDAQAAGTIRADLRRRGTPVGPYDLLIAATAMARGLTLVTANVRELSRVAGLTIESWR